jgi:hypothetical protein
VFVSKLSPEQWAEARRLYAAGQTCRTIAERFGLRGDTVRRRARAEAWLEPLAAASAPSSAGRTRTQAGRPSPATAAIRAELAHRLMSVIAVQIRMKELYMMSGEFVKS